MNDSLIPVTIFTIEDTDMPNVISEEDLKLALLADGNTLARSGHLFRAHEKWNLSNADGSVRSIKSYAECLATVKKSKTDAICLVDLDLGDDVNGSYLSFFTDNQLGPVAMGNPRDRAGLAFAFQTLEALGNRTDIFVFLVFCTVTLSEYALLTELRNHPAWVKWSSRMDYTMSFPRQCNTRESVSQNVGKAIDGFLDAKGYGPDPEDRIRKGSMQWFPNARKKS